MKKSLITILVLMLAMCIGGACSSFAADTDDGYSYVLKIYSGNQGTFKDGSKVKTVKLEQGETYTFSNNDVKLTNDKYYKRGFRIAGHDNDEVTGYSRITFTAYSDASYEMAYGIKGEMVAYTVNYVDDSGSALGDSDTFYGMIGDKPVVSYKYFEGYVPDADNKAKTLTDNAEDNVFTFVYATIGTVTTTDTDNDGDNDGNGDGGNGNGANGGNGAGNTANAAAAGAGAPGTAGNPAGGNVAGNGNGNGNGNGGTTIGDNPTPRNPYQDLDEKEGGFSALQLTLGAVGLAILLALLLYFLMKRKKDEEGMDDEPPFGES